MHHTPNAVGAPVHDRVPAILLPENEALWLDLLAHKTAGPPLWRAASPQLAVSKLILLASTPTVLRHTSGCLRNERLGTAPANARGANCCWTGRLRSVCGG